ncbi:hypothetical protein SDC9_67894 [bioreactor metagenome]|uniref:Uncharacterized protein n=1 Tax=bioreactor metagenome TaxID=1076179 RepID=A0A644XYZ0_9ZZZZ
MKGPGFGLFECPSAVGLDPVGFAREGTEVREAGLARPAFDVGDGVVHIAPAGLAGSPGKDIDRVALFDGESHPGGGLIGVDRSYGGGVEDWADDYLRMGQELGESRLGPI